MRTSAHGRPMSCSNDLFRKKGFKAATDIDRHQFPLVAGKVVRGFGALSERGLFRICLQVIRTYILRWPWTRRP